MRPVYSSSALEASGVIVTDDAFIKDIHVTNTGASDWYFQLFEQTTVPADTAVPFDSVRVPAGTTAYITWRQQGLEVRGGLAFAVSTTAATKTLGAAEAFVSSYG